MFGKIISVIMLVLILGIAAAGVYLYDYHVFRTSRTCITQDSIIYPINCTSDQYCLDLFKNNLTNFTTETAKLPEFMKIKMNEVFDNSAYCDKTCKMRISYGMGFNGTDDIASCKPGEKEILMQIHGREALELMAYLKQNPEKIEETI